MPEPETTPRPETEQTHSKSYAIFKGSHRQLINDFMDGPKWRKFYDQEKQSNYQQQLDKDYQRQHHIAFNNDFLQYSQLYNSDYYEKMLSYTQGDRTAQFVEQCMNMLFTDSDCNWTENFTQFHDASRGKPFYDTLSFSYIDDDNIPCAIGINRSGQWDDKNNQKYMILHIRNTDLDPDKREETYMVEKTLLDQLPTKPSKLPIIPEKDVFTGLEKSINSKAVYTLISKITQNGHISRDEYDKLRHRLKPHTNIDDRDVRKNILESWLDALKMYNPQYAQFIAFQAKNDINFYETSRFDKLLFNSLPINSKTWNIYGEKLYSVQIRYLVSKNYKNFTRKEAEEEEKRHTEKLTEDLERKIYTLDSTYIELVKKNQILALKSEQDIKQDIARAYNQNYLEDALYNLDSYIGACRHPYRAMEARYLSDYVKTIPFDRLSPYGQQTLRALIVKWTIFDNGSEESYKSILQDYRLLGIRLPDKKSIMQNEEQAQITWLLEQPIPRNYTFDLQGRIIYDTHDYSENRVTISDEISKDDPRHKDYFNKLTTVLKQVSNINDGLKKTQDDIDTILTLLRKLPSTAGIRPLQQEMHIFLSQLAQTCQQKFYLDESVCQEMLAETLEEASEAIMGEFALALLKNVSKETSDLDSIRIATINTTLDLAWDRQLLNMQEKLYQRMAKQLDAASSKKPMDIPLRLCRGATTPLLHTNRTLGLVTWQDTRKPSTKPGMTHQTFQTYAWNSKENKIILPRARQQAIMPYIVHQPDQTKQYQETMYTQLNHIGLFYSFNSSFSYQTFPDVSAKTSDNLRQILLATHQYNRTHMKNVTNLGWSELGQHIILAFCNPIHQLPQGFSLGYSQWFSPLRNETTLMTEMALMQQIPDAFDPKKTYQKFIDVEKHDNIYKRFARQFRPLFFYRTTLGQQARDEIQKKKDTWKKKFENVEKIDTNTLLTLTLEKIMAFNLHLNEKHKDLTQVIALAQNPQALVCIDQHSKEAKLILGMAQLLEAAPIPYKILVALKNLAQATNSNEANTEADELYKQLNYHYMNFNTYGPGIQATQMNSTAITEAIHAIPEKTEFLNTYLLKTPSYTEKALNTPIEKIMPPSVTVEIHTPIKPEPESEIVSPPSVTLEKKEQTINSNELKNEPNKANEPLISINEANIFKKNLSDQKKMEAPTFAKPPTFTTKK